MSDFEEEFVRELEKEAESVREDVAAEWRGEYRDRVESSYQGAEGLSEFVGPVEERDGDIVFEVDHPTAKLHELGGPIEPTYTYAQLRGYSRDEFYAALEDCEDVVWRKRLMHRARVRVRDRLGDR